MRLKDTIGISYYMRSAQHELTNEIDAALKKLNLTSAQYSVLALSEEQAGLSNAELARRLSVTPQTMSRIMKNLEKNGFVKKGEVSEFSLTQKGEKIVCSAHEAVNEIETVMVEGLSKNQINDLKQVLQTCFENIKKHESQSHS